MGAGPHAVKTHHDDARPCTLYARADPPGAYSTQETSSRACIWRRSPVLGSLQHRSPRELLRFPGVPRRRCTSHHTTPEWPRRAGERRARRSGWSLTRRVVRRAKEAVCRHAAVVGERAVPTLEGSRGVAPWRGTLQSAARERGDGGVHIDSEVLPESRVTRATCVACVRCVHIRYIRDTVRAVISSPAIRVAPRRRCGAVRADGCAPR